MWVASVGAISRMVLKRQGGGAVLPLARPVHRFSAHIGFLFTEQPLPKRFAAASAAGFRAVEHPNPFGYPAREIAMLLDAHELHYVQTSFPAGDPARGEKGFAALPKRAAEFRASIVPTLDYAETIGCRLIHAMAGVRPMDAAPERLWDTYLESLAVAADAAARRGMSILIEPVGPGSIANYIVDDPAIAIDAITALSRPNVKLLFDVFHCVSLGQDPVTLIETHSDLIAHVQIADHPGRHEPGSGSIDFDPVFQALERVSYAGYIGCEYHPSGATTDSFGWLDADGEPTASAGEVH